MNARICSTFYKHNVDENGNKTGTASPTRQATFGEIMTQFKATLRAIPYGDLENGALEAAEYASFFKPRIDEDKPVPQGYLVVTPQYGHCEGNLIVLSVVSREHSNTIIPLVSAKFFIDMKETWKISEQVYEACHQALYDVIGPEDIQA